MFQEQMYVVVLYFNIESQDNKQKSIQIHVL